MLAKWLWMVVVLVAFGVYLWQNFTDVLRQLSFVPPLLLILSFGIAMLGRQLFIGASSEVLVLLGYPQSFRNVFYLAATSELGKYLPGGIWHVVGRMGYYRILGIPVSAISRILLQDSAWAALSAGMLGVFLLIPVRQLFGDHVEGDR